MWVAALGVLCSLLVLLARSVSASLFLPAACSWPVLGACVWGPRQCSLSLGWELPPLASQTAHTCPFPRAHSTLPPKLLRSLHLLLDNEFFEGQRAIALFSFWVLGARYSRPGLRLALVKWTSWAEAVPAPLSPVSQPWHRPGPWRVPAERLVPAEVLGALCVLERGPLCGLLQPTFFQLLLWALSWMPGAALVPLHQCSLGASTVYCLCCSHLQKPFELHALSPSIQMGKLRLQEAGDGAAGPQHWKDSVCVPFRPLLRRSGVPAAFLRGAQQVVPWLTVAGPPGASGASQQARIPPRGRVKRKGWSCHFFFLF